MGLLGFALLVGWVGIAFERFLLVPISVLAVMAALFSIYFFRDPQRHPPPGDDNIVSPADGVIMDIDRVLEEEFFGRDVQRIAIFLSLFDMHVNYVPFAGTVEYLRYHRGTFKPAFLKEAGQENANILTGLETRSGKMAVKQSAGIIARRLVNYLRLDDKVEKGQKLGMIKFGSRVDFFLPDTVTILVKKGDHLKSGETIVATVNE